MTEKRQRSFYKEFNHFKKIFKTYAFRKYNLFDILIIWSKRKLSRFQFLVFSGVLVGFLGGFAGVILKVIVHYIETLSVGDLDDSQRTIAYAIFPFVGIVSTTLIARYLYKRREDIKLHNVLVDIAQHNSNINKQEIHSRMVQSAITVGFGGSAGLETPMAITGAAIGSNFGKRYRLGYKEKTLLLAGGAAAGIAAAFNAPIAGVMFSFEMLLTGVVFSDFIPLVISSLCGSILTHLVLNDDILFRLTDRTDFSFQNLGFYLLLAVVAGFYARYYSVASKKVSNLLEKFPFGSLKRAFLGAAILAVLCVLFPALYSEGYINIKMLHQDDFGQIVHNFFIEYFGHPELVIFIVMLLSTLFKPMATSASLNSGGVGGNFAPSLIAGGLMGYTFGYGLFLLGFINTPITNLMLVGMAGVLAGVLYAPLTAIFLIAEASSGYDLLIPLMIVSVTSFLINKYFSPYNPSYDKLVKAGKIFTTHHDENILSQIRLKDCLDEDSLKVLHTATLQEIRAVFSDSSKSVLAVVDEKNHFIGMIHKEQLTKLTEEEKNNETLTAYKLAISPNHIVSPHERIEDVVKKFEESNVWYLPIVNEQHQYKGFVSRFRFLIHYRKLLKDLS